MLGEKFSEKMTEWDGREGISNEPHREDALKGNNEIMSFDYFTRQNDTGEADDSVNSEQTFLQKMPTRIFSRKERVHQKDEKVQLCPICEETFSTTSLLLSHILTHTGEKPRVCDFCGSTFARQSDLEIHARIHLNGELLCGVCDTTMAAQHSRIGKEQETTKGKSSFFCKSTPFCDISTSGPEDSEIVCSEDHSLKPTKRSISKLSSGTSLHGKKKAPNTSKKAPCRRSKSDEKKRLKKSKEREKNAPNFLKGGIQYYIPQVGEKEPHIEIHNGQCVISHFDGIKDVCTVGTEASSSLAECEIDHCTDMNDSTESTFLCELCSDILPSIDLFEKHLRVHIEKNQDALEVQNVMDRLAEKYGAILNCSVEISALDIFRCEKTFSNSLVLKKHSKTHQNEQTVGEPSITDEQSRHSEDYDDVAIETKARRSWKKRETKREGQYFRFHSSKMGWFPCKMCKLTFGAEDYLNKHMNVQHSHLAHEKRKRIKTRQKWIIRPTYYCSLCSRSFPGINNINRHMQMHMDASYICEVCGQVILRLMNIRKHVKRCCPDSENEGKTVPEGDPESLGKKKQKFSAVEGSQREKGKRIESVV